MARPESARPEASNGNAPRHRIGMILAAILLALASIWFTRNPPINGDGIEYLAMSASIVNHHTPDLRKSDVSGLLTNKAIQDINRNYMSRLVPVVDEGKDGVNYGYFHASNGSYYSYHFWLYSALNAPGLVLATWLNVDPVNSFLFTNVLLLLLATLFVTLANNFSPAQKWTLFTLIWLGGCSFYVSWSSPEVFTFAMLVMSGVALKQRSYFLSAFFLAAAAQQNPPIGLLGGTVLLLALPGLWESRAQPARFLGGLFKGGAVAVTLLLSPAFYFLHFGTPNLIAGAGQASASNISVERLISFFFDLNQGLIVGVPGLILGSMIALLYFFGGGRLKQLPLGTLVLASLCTLALVIPCLATKNFNSGSSGMARYALWCSVPAGFALVELIGRMGSAAWRLASIGGLVIAQILLFVVYRSPFNGGSYLEFQPAARFVLRHFPQLYGPVPEIFAERGTHRDNGTDSGSTYFYVQNGRIVRVLFDRSAGALWLPACPGFNPSLPPLPLGGSSWAYASPERDSCPSEMPEGLHVVRRGMQSDVAPVLNNELHSKVWNACNLPSLTGSTTESCHRVAKPGVNSPGFLMFGPYVHLPTGKYEVIFKVRSGDSAGKWDISSGASGVVASGEFTDTQSEYVSVSVPLVITPKMDGDSFEFRIYFTGQSEIDAQGVTLKLLP